MMSIYNEVVYYKTTINHSRWRTGVDTLTTIINNSKPEIVLST
jgi:hypothetical protein